MNYDTPSLRQNQSPIVENSVISPQAERTYRILVRLILTNGGALQWAKERVAAYCQLALGTYQDHRRELERAGKIIIGRKRRPGCRFQEFNIIHLPTKTKKIYQVLEIQQGIKDLTTNTNTKAPRVTARVTEPVKSYVRLRWEHHREHNHPPAMRALYERNGALMDENRGLRHHVRCSGGLESPEEREARLEAIRAGDRQRAECEARDRKWEAAYDAKWGIR